MKTLLAFFVGLFTPMSKINGRAVMTSFVLLIFAFLAFRLFGLFTPIDLGMRIAVLGSLVTSVFLFMLPFTLLMTWSMLVIVFSLITRFINRLFGTRLPSLFHNHVCF